MGLEGKEIRAPLIIRHAIFEGGGETSCICPGNRLEEDPITSLVNLNGKTPVSIRSRLYLV